MLQYNPLIIRIILTVFFAQLLLAGCIQRGEENSRNKDQSNRLADAGSPYLQEHADNPVDWFEWSEEALEKARTENKPLIISIGYASCHWCHVMEEESFMDTSVARIMNENFVSIKIDREERPDIDQIYLNAAQLISGSAGWPLNAFALPDGKPFYAGTYFPKHQWIKLIQKVIDAYKKENAMIVKQAEELTKGIQTYEVITLPADSLYHYGKKNYYDLSNSWEPYVDYQSGGLRGAPKFPMPANWELLLQYNHLTGNKKSLEAVMTTLDALAKGGIYDQLGGGFSRYSTDEIWKVPHFEKMLYDNGQLVSLYAHAYQKTQNPLYAEVIHSTLDFIKRELTAPNGGFYSSVNADSEEEEGKFYVWTKSEIEKIVPKNSVDLFMKYYQVSDSGNWENGSNILHRKSGRQEFALKHNIPTAAWSDILKEAKEQLMEARNKRVRPSTDDKILTAWNALMLKGYVDAYLALGNNEYLITALKNARFLEKNMMRKEGGLWRSYKDNKAGIEAFLDDYALLARSFIHLYQATFDIHWLEKSRALADYAIDHFQEAQSGLFYYTSNMSENLIARKMELADNVTPASNSVLADVLFLLGQYYNEDRYVTMSQSMLNQVYQDIANNPMYYANWARLLGLNTLRPFEVAIMGEQAVEKSIQLQKHYLPDVIFMGGIKEDLPLLENKYVEGQTIIYVCRNRTCKLPVKSVESAFQQLNE